ncbi:uncharacterized protein LOC122611483 isoform X2 [Drosophila teissieri]|uniref:uncharacterized protein LOC122611483 isoform X2 n=1 Tax=Drosophila teissieri TaxID=7243 RepID=UPI001CBA0B5F|nr:uncharacterized protein LOC122611483 isoform X2 [Drosophila teissieri]
MITSKLRLRRAQIPRFPITSRWYNWGNYDASSGECCKMRDKDVTACKGGKWFCPVNICRRSIIGARLIPTAC